MRWSWKIAEFKGIGVYVHATFSLLIIFFIMQPMMNGASLSAALVGVAFIVSVFACVVLHEFGHALMAQKYGIKTRDITLYPIGGVARLERMPDVPMHEFYVALAGPAVNVVIAAILFVLLGITHNLRSIEAMSLSEGPFFERLMLINIFLVLFNMLPAFPMDGGRVLRAVLATRMDYARATSAAAHIGQAMAFMFGLVGLFSGNPFLVFIALFVWIGAAQEAGMAQIKSAIGGIPVSHAMLTDFQTLSPNDSLARAIELILSGSQQDFPVVEDGGVVGILTRNDLLSGLANGGKETPVQQVMRRDFRVADSRDMLERVFTQLQAQDVHIMPVMQTGRMVGLLTAENVGEYLMIQSALRGDRKKANLRSYDEIAK